MKKGFSFLLILAALGLIILSWPVQESVVHDEAAVIGVEQPDKVVLSEDVQKQINRNYGSYAELKSDIKKSLLDIKGTSLIQRVLGQGPITDFKYRYRALKEMLKNDDLGGDEIRDIIGYLSINTTPGGDNRKEESIRNDLLNLLLFQKRIPRELGAMMIAGYEDPDTSHIWRDYILQYISVYIDRVHVQKKLTQVVLREWNVLEPKDEVNALVSIYEEAAYRRWSTYSGTAIIGLEKLYSECQIYPKENLVKFCEQLLVSNGNHLSQATALQILATLDLNQAYDVSEKMLKEDFVKDDILIASCINVYLKKTGDSESLILKDYKSRPLFSKVIENHFKNK
jgi:hypothetical protein